MVLLLNNLASVYLLVAFSLNNGLRICGVVLKEGVQDFTPENKIRPEVRTPQGTVQGINLVTHHGRNIFGFKGIPFAQPPVGNLRFKAPVPGKPWNGTLDASNDLPPCPQLAGQAVIGSEDCLHLNVYTPWLPAGENSTLLPVMVFIFGGGHKKGSPSSTLWGPYFLLDKDVVLVVPNYRLGPLGFLSTGDEVAPGNYGLKDMVRALEWNRDNIQFFGGDPSQVTIAGGSSGAMATHLLTLSNLTNGLFHRYITQSGTALSAEATRSRSGLVNRATRLGKYFGCPTNSSIALVTCLRGIDTSRIVKSDPVFYTWRDEPINVWGPTVEPDTEGAVLTDTPANLFAGGKIRDLPWLCSSIPEEGYLFQIKTYNNEEVYQDYLHNIDAILPFHLLYDNLVENVTAYTTALKSHYLNDMAADRNLVLKNVTQLMGHGLFHYPLYRAIKQFLIRAKSPLYLSSFEYRGTFSHSYSLTGGDTVNWGPVHGDECIYLFQTPSGLFGRPENKMTNADWKMVDKMVQLWTSFVINGTPTMENLNSTIVWEPYSIRKSYLQIGSNSDTSLNVKYNFFEDRAHFWEELTATTSWK